MMSYYSAGHKVVHKTHGVGIIEGSEVLSLGGHPQDYYVLKIVESGLMVRFPKTSQGLIRELVTDDDIGNILSILSSSPKTYSTIWNRRKKEFSDKIRSGSLFEIAEVLRDLVGKDKLRLPSFGEKEMIERARARLVSEIASAKETDAAKVEGLIDHALSFPEPAQASS
ncbi:MAG: CarD family transcriptional regulator [Bdellovibrionota bacterium]|nr:MAG: CarD family transcriptional regulator [Pseudomonadota bacterium]